MRIITFLNLKYDIIENSRIELRGIVLPVPSNEIKELKLHLLLFYPSTWYIRDFFLFHIEIEGKVGGLFVWGGGGKVYVAPPPPPPPPPSQIIGWGPGPPLPTPMVTESNDTCILPHILVTR